MKIHREVYLNVFTLRLPDGIHLARYTRINGSKSLKVFNAQEAGLLRFLNLCVP